MRLDAGPFACTVRRPRGDRVAIAAYLGAAPSADHALTEFAETYADRNDRDFELFEDAAKASRMEAVRGI